MNGRLITLSAFHQSLAGCRRTFAFRGIGAVSAGFAILSCAAMLIGAAIQTGVPRADEFRLRAELAMGHGEHDLAMIWAKRAVAEAPLDQENAMLMARLHHAAGRFRPLMDILNVHAPMHRAGYAPAHLYRAELVLLSAGITPAARQHALECLDLAIEAAGSQDRDDGSIARRILDLRLDLEAAGGQWQKAVRTLEEIGDPTPEQLITKAEALKALGMKTEAARACEEALSEERLAYDGCRVERRFARAVMEARCALVMEDERRALEIMSLLIDDISGERHHAGLEAACVRIFGMTARQARIKKPDNATLWIECITEGLGNVPDSLALTLEFLSGYGKWSYLPGFREKLIARCSETPLAAFRKLVDGLKSMREGDIGAVERHFEAAYKEMPRNPVIANNFAAFIGTRPVGRQTERAMEIINRVIAAHPFEASFLETRGLILLGAGDNRGAVESLEAAIRINPQPVTHLALAEAYARMGMMEESAEHRRAADWLSPTPQ